MANWNPRFVRYAQAHGRGPEAQFEHDKRDERPSMMEFMFWIQARWREWRKLKNYHRDRGMSEADHVEFDTWLEAFVIDLTTKGTQ